MQRPVDSIPPRFVPQPNETLAGRRERSWEDLGWLLVSTGLLALHAFLIWSAMGGWGDLSSDWPLLQADHGFHYHHGIMSRSFLRESGFSAGYDPSFMAGFPMSVISGTSSTLSNVAIFLFGGAHPAIASKFSTLACVALAPVMVGWASVLFGAKPSGVAGSIAFYQVYFWTDFPKNYAGFGMVSFLLAIPLGLVAVASLCKYLEAGGWWRWVGAAAACSAVFFVHITSPMVVGPAGVTAYVLASFRSLVGKQAFPVSRQIGFWLLPVVILAANAFWTLPGFWLRSTLGGTDFVFAHPESVLGRLGEIFWKEAAVESVTIGVGLVGCLVLGSFRPVAGYGLAGFVAAGLGWGYLAGAFRGLDGLQPGRQTYAMYSGLCVAAGYAWGELSDWLRSARPGRLDRWVMVGFVLAGVRIFGPSIEPDIRFGVFGPVPFLSSRPHPQVVRLIANIKKHVKPGERLLFEETGFSSKGNEDPFSGRHFSPILPEATGVEVLGGPYLHTPVSANFTQFGEGKLFGDPDWGRDQFVRYARLYRPSAIACWSPKARAFCKANPDLVETLEDDGTLLLGRVVGFEGATIRGSAKVEAGANRLVVRDAVADADGLVVLRYHAVPCLVAEPPTPIEPIFLEDDPVPFIGLRPDRSGPITLKVALPPTGGWFTSPGLGGRR